MEEQGKTKSQLFAEQVRAKGFDKETTVNGKDIYRYSKLLDYQFKVPVGSSKVLVVNPLGVVEATFNDADQLSAYVDSLS